MYVYLALYTMYVSIYSLCKLCLCKTITKTNSSNITFISLYLANSVSDCTIPFSHKSGPSKQHTACCLFVSCKVSSYSSWSEFSPILLPHLKNPKLLWSSRVPFASRPILFCLFRRALSRAKVVMGRDHRRSNTHQPMTVSVLRLPIRR